MMAGLRKIWDEFWGLFMDDPRFAAAILAWLVVTGGGLPWLGVPKGLLPIVVVIGLVGILMASIIRRARS
jgi:hypothetical protein